jgi:RNA polymerase sigma-70 factor (ECF subfamily)
MLIALSYKRFLGLFGLASIAAYSRVHNEAAYVRAGRSGDQEAFQSLMDLYSKPMRQFAARRVPNTDLDDVLQETWLSIWQSLASFEGETRFRQWAFSICYRKVQDYWRREHSRGGKELSSLSDDQRTYVPKEFEQVELRDSIEAFWKTCSDEHREVLTMYYGDGLTMKEISEILGRNLNTVKYQFYRAHENAAERLPELESSQKRRRK